MDFITSEEVEKIAKPGDKLKGILFQYPNGLPENKMRVDELTFWDCIGCLTGKQDVVDGADYFLQKQEDGTFEKFGIIRKVGQCTKVPKEFIENIVCKYNGLKTIVPFKNPSWKKEELINCYYEEDTDSTSRPCYCCCFNRTGDAFVEEFYTTTAVWAYLNTNMDVEDIHTLDTLVLNKDTYIRVLKDLVNAYKKKAKENKKK